MRPRGITRGNDCQSVKGWFTRDASMRPRGITRGNTRPCRRRSPAAACFNEAAGYYPRKRCPCLPYPACHHGASMRPRGITRGNGGLPARLEAFLIFLLQ